jgi:hypothetical protein
MEMSNFPFQTTDWSQIEKTEHKGETFETNRILTVRRES